MEHPITLAQKRDQLTHQMEAYRSLPEYILDGIGANLKEVLALFQVPH